jgi:hypothetical protein
MMILSVDGQTEGAHRSEGVTAGLNVAIVSSSSTVWGVIDPTGGSGDYSSTFEMCGLCLHGVARYVIDSDPECRLRNDP